MGKQDSRQHRSLLPVISSIIKSGVHVQEIDF